MYNCSVFSTILETLRLRFFLGISLEPRTSRSHVTRALPSGLRFEVHVCTARPRSRDQMFTARFFCTLKHHNPTFEKKYNFLELFCIVIIEFSFEDNFSAKIAVSGWMKANMTATSYYPRTLSPKYGHTINAKPLTANRSLSFPLKWPNLDLKVSSVHFPTLLLYVSY